MHLYKNMQSRLCNNKGAIQTYTRVRAMHLWAKGTNIPLPWRGLLKRPPPRQLQETAPAPLAQCWLGLCPLGAMHHAMCCTQTEPTQDGISVHNNLALSLSREWYKPLEIQKNYCFQHFSKNYCAPFERFLVEKGHDSNELKEASFLKVWKLLLQLGDFFHSWKKWERHGCKGSLDYNPVWISLRSFLSQIMWTCTFFCCTVC